MLSRVHIERTSDGVSRTALFRSRSEAIRLVMRINREGWGLRYLRREDHAVRQPGERVVRGAEDVLQGRA